MEAVSGGRRLVCADGGQNRQRTAAAFLHPPNHRVQPLSTDLATIPPPHLAQQNNLCLEIKNTLSSQSHKSVLMGILQYWN